MAEPARTLTSGRSPRRSVTAGAAWKSGLLASGIGAVLLGWALLVRAENPTIAAALPPSQPNVLIAQAPAVAQGSQLRGQSSGSRVTAPSLPQAPVFRRPITRSRGS